MRIVIDMQGAQTESRFRGIGRYTLSFAQAVVRNRGEHEVLLALSGLLPDTIEPIRAAFDGLLPQENIRVWQAPGPVRDLDAKNCARREVAELLREAYLASLRPDVIHISSLFEGYADDAVTSIKKIDRDSLVSVSLYDLIPLLNPDQYLKPNPSYAAYYERKVHHLKRADCYLAISEHARQEGLQCLGVDGTCITNISTAIEPQFQPVLQGEERKNALFRKLGLTRPFVLYTGGVDERKNLPRLLEAWSALPGSLREAHQLLFAGRMPEDRAVELRRIAKARGLAEDELVISGYVSDEELIQLYNLCKLFVFPSWHEGFGLPALEAMACGAPVIGANTTSLPEVIALDEALFDPFDVAAMAKKIAEALQDKVFQGRLRANGTQQATNFSWDATAKRAVIAWEMQLSSRTEQGQLPQSAKPKPKLAFVSPLPPERTGIADYSAELLPALAQHYDIDVVVDHECSTPSSVLADYKAVSPDWLLIHGHEYDRVLYQFGNSPYHAFMLPLLESVPGVVVLHDFFLSSLMAWLENQPSHHGDWKKALLHSHGYTSVREQCLNPSTAKRQYPANWPVIQHALGIITHSRYAKDLGEQWYPGKNVESWEVIPLLRASNSRPDRQSARQELGIHENDFLVCCFGFIDSTKLNHRLLDAWIDSALSDDIRCRLIFVGENHGENYGKALSQYIESCQYKAQISITGFVSARVFHRYLAAADMAVQLRAESRGETSAAILDCMNHGLAVIANKNGSFAELDDEAVRLLPDDFSDRELTEALELLWRDPDLRRRMGNRARNIIREKHAPNVCAQKYMEAIERAYQYPAANRSTLIKAIAAEIRETSDDQLWSIARAISRNMPENASARRVLLDVTGTANLDRKTGIERVVRGLLKALLDSPPSGYRIEPVYLSNTGGYWCYRRASQLACSVLDVPAEDLADEVMEASSGDVLITMDLSGDALIQAHQSGLFNDLQNRGVAVHAVVYDLLPVLMPDVFPPGADATHARWLQAVSSFDGAMCISRAVADELISWRRSREELALYRRPYKVGWFHLGADVDNSVPSRGLPPTAQQVLDQLSARISFLMVGTIEPRKGHLQVIEAFHRLWQQGLDVNLVVVGKEGWKDLPDSMRRNIPAIVEQLHNHPETGKRLFWLDGISDEYLEQVYASCDCLIAASYGEGFGLPLIEASRHNIAVIARDIPVFREVAGPSTGFFKGADPEDLAKYIVSTMGTYKKPKDSENARPSMDWMKSSRDFLRIALQGEWYRHEVSEKFRRKALVDHLNHIHQARVKMVSQLLPEGEIILDLGGANCPVYKMGYPHQFKKLYLIDLPPENRHEMYKEIVIDPNCDGGEVVIRYGDMTELHDFADESVDFVWSGQSIEHVSPEAGERMCKAAFRVLKKGGAFCLDTPNRMATEIHVRGAGIQFIHPEHCIEYRPEELKSLLTSSGFEIKSSLGICEMKNTVATGEFCYEDFVLGEPITADVNRGYIQFFHCIKP